MPMPDSPKTTWRPPLLALLIVGLVAQAQGQTNPVHVADLVDLPIVDESNLVMGRVRAVVRTGEGKIELLLPLGGLFGFGERLVPIPIESVALAGPQVVVVDMPPHRFQKTPTWYGSNSAALAAAETISIARR
jgi:ribosomal 30S subunit maturation factor RimM